MRPPRITARFLIPFAVLWLAVTIPLLSLGYGSDVDSWLVARSADAFWTTHTYNPSRSSGFPLFELGISPLVHFGGSRAANTFALLGGVSLLSALAFLGRRGALRHPRLVLILVGFLPVVLKNATSTVDYLLSLSLLCWAYVAVWSGRFAVAMVLAGVACGFRPQAVIYFVPLTLHLLHLTRSLQRTSLLALLGGSVALLVYSPVLLTAGLQTGYKDYRLGADGHVSMLGYNALQVLGIVPTMLLAGVVIHALRAPAGHLAAAPREIPHRGLHAGVFVVYGAVFAAMPHEPEYLLPALLSLVFVLDAVLDRRHMIAATCVALSYHAFRLEVVGGASAHRKLALSIRSGYLVRDIGVRRFLLSTREALTRFTPDRPTVLMFGADWAPMSNPAFEEISWSKTYRKRGADYYLSDSLVDEEIDAWRARGFRVVLWKGWMKDFESSDHTPDWRTRVDVVPALEEYLGAKIEGQPMWPSE